MQNGADAAALGAATTLAVSVVLSGSVPVYSATNGNVTARVEQALVGNRGGVTAPPVYSAPWSTVTTLQPPRGTATRPLPRTTMAPGPTLPGTCLQPYARNRRCHSGNCLHRQSHYLRSGHRHPNDPGAGCLGGSAQQRPGLQSGWTYLAYDQVRDPDVRPEYGICHPFLFLVEQSKRADLPDAGQLKNLLQLGAHQGASYEGGTITGHEQLLTQPDTRPAMDEATDSNNPCPNYTAEWYDLWSPGGNCTDPTIYPHTFPTGYGTECCSNNDSAAKIDIGNYIRNEFHGRISLTSTWPDSYFRPGFTDRPAGDWLEVYNGGDLGNNIAQQIEAYVGEHGVLEGFTGYGKHVDKVMYLYDTYRETWKTTCPNCSNYQWLPTDNNDQPNRVHMSQALRFRFYEAMVDEGGFDTPEAVCGVSDRYNTNNSQVYGVFLRLGCRYAAMREPSMRRRPWAEQFRRLHRPLMAACDLAA